MDIHIELARPSDIDALVALRLAYLEADHGALDAETAAALARALPGYFRDHLGRDLFCYVARERVDLLPVQQEAFTTGLISMNGKTAGTAKVSVRSSTNPKSAEVAQWTIGTPVAVISRAGEYIQVEGKGRRGWINQKYFTPDAE